MIYIGIDPGLSGGIAALSEGGMVLEVSRMPATELDIIGFFGECYACHRVEGRPRAMIEKVGVMPKQGIVSAFTFGRGYGGLLMALTALSIPFDLVLPARWQLELGCRSRGDKNVTKRRAQQLFPHVKITHANADALLIAEFCRRTHRLSQREGTTANGKEERSKEEGHAGAQGREEAGRQKGGTGTGAAASRSRRRQTDNGLGAESDIARDGGAARRAAR